MYIDTSVAVKLYTPEPDSEHCELLIGGEGLSSSELLFGEMSSALLSKERAGLISSECRKKTWQLFVDHLDFGQIHLIALNGIIVREAQEVMMEVHPAVPLRTLDAIHLATYLSVDAGLMFTKDKRMIEAARRLNLPLAG